MPFPADPQVSSIARDLLRATQGLDGFFVAVTKAISYAEQKHDPQAFRMEL
jgi:hypothetical protein